MSLKMEVALIEKELNNLRAKVVMLTSEDERKDKIIASLECQLAVMTARVHKMVDNLCDAKEVDNEQTA